MCVRAQQHQTWVAGAAFAEVVAPAGAANPRVDRATVANAMAIARFVFMSQLTPRLDKLSTETRR